MKKYLPLLLSIFFSIDVSGQASGLLCTNPLAEQVMLGNYNPSTFQATNIINHPDSIVNSLIQNINPDTLKKYIIQLAGFHNRNTGSDTLSSTRGFGAARRWVHSKFQEYSQLNNNRLIPSYFQFNQLICGMPVHRNIIAVLPGADTTDKSIILVEGHMDSRCEVLCDTACVAQGVEDNASGTALVMELARVMSGYTFNRTIVFMINTSEEQGLNGAEAFADYVLNKGIKIKAVQNNDVIGGIICGTTSSPPSCPGLNMIDSMQLRLFSFGGFNSFHKQYVRFVKLEYKEKLVPIVPIVMTISVMSAEDRSGRGGDHIPFRQHGYTSIRFTSANEHGDANVASPGYTDRQHSYRDTLGVDTDSDNVIDSFFVDFNYLARNAVINGNAIAMAAIGPKVPDFTVTAAGLNTVSLEITQEKQYGTYRFAVRSTTNDWDTVFTMNDTIGTFTLNPATVHYFSVASVDSNGTESLFSKEILLTIPNSIAKVERKQGIALLPNQPNPFDEATIISVYVDKTKKYKEAFIRVTDLSGKEIQKMPIQLQPGMNETLYEHGYNVTGTFIYSLIIDGVVIDSRRMVFAN